jgi:hypothetical protein
MSSYYPNMGRLPTMFRPVDLDYFVKDVDTDLPVQLLVYIPPKLYTLQPDLAPRDRHWSISWLVPHKTIRAHRVLHIVVERGHYHYTNWGPMTISWDVDVHVRQLPLKTMSLIERRQLEDIASNTQVLVPNGEWNCQNWVETVLREAVKDGPLTNECVDNVLSRALE